MNRRGVSTVIGSLIFIIIAFFAIITILTSSTTLIALEGEITDVLEFQSERNDSFFEMDDLTFEAENVKKRNCIDTPQLPENFRGFTFRLTNLHGLPVQIEQLWINIENAVVDDAISPTGEPLATDATNAVKNRYQCDKIVVGDVTRTTCQFFINPLLLDSGEKKRVIHAFDWKIDEYFRRISLFGI